MCYIFDQPIKSSPQHQTTPPTSIPTSSVSMQSFNNEVSQFVATYTVPGDEPITVRALCNSLKTNIYS